MKHFELIKKPNGEIYGIARYARTITSITSIEGGSLSNHYTTDSEKLNNFIYSLQESGHSFKAINENEFKGYQKSLFGIEPYLKIKIG